MRLSVMEQAQFRCNDIRTLHAVRSARRFQRKRIAGSLLAFAIAVSAWPCSGVGPVGKPVVFGNQTNIVIWDEAHQTEHFIRNANFKSGADDFGFIAPTPGKPDLSEASSQAFYTLASLAPRQMYGSFGGGGGRGFGARSAADEVRVIQVADVAGYHATTLWSRSAQAINDWMNQHGYVSTPEVEKWAERYTAKGWFLTAFKVIDKTKLAASTGTVRMSFRTRHPYNPFYVPATNIPVNGGSVLRVYFVSVGNYEARIGSGEIWQVPQWTAAIPWNLSDKLAEQVKLPSDAIPNRAQVATFVDYNFPRPAADDIYFTKKRVAMTPRRPSHPTASVKAGSPIRWSKMPPALAGVALLTLVWNRRKGI